MAMLDQRWLGIYLNDHLAGATAGVELANRAVRSSTRHRDWLRRLAADIAEDRLALKRVMQSLDVAEQSYKQYGAWIAEKVGRLKLNGRLFNRSPVSDVLEIEALRLTVEAKAAGWRLLRRLAELDGRLDGDLLDRLLTRADDQIKVLEDLRLDVAVEVFAPPRQ